MAVPIVTLAPHYHTLWTFFFGFGSVFYEFAASVGGCWILGAQSAGWAQALHSAVVAPICQLFLLIFIEVHGLPLFAHSSLSCLLFLW